jgi:hypothetical protein
MDLHPRFALSALSSYRNTFAEDLALWDTLGVRHVGLFQGKLDAHGYDEAVATLEGEGFRASCVVGPLFELGRPDTWDETLRRAGDRIALVQINDLVIGTFDDPGPGGRVVPGDGWLDLDRFLASVTAAGYTGPVELEVVGGAIEAEGYESALRRGIGATNALLARAFA